MHGASNRDTHLHPLYDNSLVYLTITTYVRRSRRVTSGVRVGEQPYKTLRFFSPTPTPNYSELPSQEEPGSNLTASALVSEVSAIACTSGVWPPLRSVKMGAKEQTVDHGVLQCPIHRTPHGLHGPTVLDDETIE